MTAPAPRLTVLGLSHRTAPVGQREKAALDEDGVRGLLRSLAADPTVAEAAAVFTCNRTELYMVCEDPDQGEAAAARELVASSRISPSELACAHYTLYDEQAAGHLFRVAAGLDSMVLGESEVQGQVRAAADLANEEGTLGTLLGGLFRRALATGRRVRRETSIGSGPISVSTAAVELARRVFEDLATRRVLLIGAGRMAAATGRALRREGVTHITVANRTHSAARDLSATLHGRTASLQRLAGELAQADIVVSSTDAPHLILHRAEVERALAGRAAQPLVLIDLAVPRDLEATIGSLPNAMLYDIDDLARVTQASLAGRRRELAHAEAIAAEELARFRDWRHALAVAPTVRSLHTQAERIRRAELRRLESELSPEELERLDRLTRALVTKLLHEPTARLRGAADRADALRHVESVRHLFALRDEDAPGHVIPLAPLRRLRDAG